MTTTGEFLIPVHQETVIIHVSKRNTTVLGSSLPERETIEVLSQYMPDNYTLGCEYGWVVCCQRMELFSVVP